MDYPGLSAKEAIQVGGVHAAEVSLQLAVVAAVVGVIPAAAAFAPVLLDEPADACFEVVCSFPH